MRTLSRRRVISTLATGGAGLALTEVLGANRVNAEINNQVQTPSAVALAFCGQHQPKPLPFDPAKRKVCPKPIPRPIPIPTFCRTPVSLRARMFPDLSEAAMMPRFSLAASCELATRLLLCAP